MSASRYEEQPGGEDAAEWVDPRYADLVAAWDESRHRHARRGEPPCRSFLYELPADRRPPSA